MICPKCRIEQPDSNTECPGCGVLFARIREREAAGGSVYRPPAGTAVEDGPGEAGGWQALLFPEPERVEPAHFWGRAVLFAFLFLWGWRFILSPVADNSVGESFMHLVNLPFHEAGHVLFGPFGDFLRALGGTLGQTLVPAVCLGAFLLRNRDPFGASAALWWLGESFMDIGPYIADARSGELLLLGGVTGRDVPGYHDWENVLGALGLMQHDQTLGALSYWVGRLLMLASFAWGGWALARQWRALRGRERIPAGS